MAMAKRSYLMVRAMGSEDFTIFSCNKVVAIGFNSVNFSALPDADAVAAAAKAEFYSDGYTNPQVAGRRLAQIRRFKKIKSGDRVLVPHGDSVSLATATGEEAYDDMQDRLANRKGVDYALTEDGAPLAIPQSELSNALQARLAVPGAFVADLFEFKDEIEGLFNIKHFDWRNRGQRVESEAANKFKDELLHRIREGTKVNLRTQLVDLENLVRDLLKVDGYMARVLPKRPFPSFSDERVQASKTDRLCGETKLLVQVKYQYGTGDTWAAELLQEIRNQVLADYWDFSLVLVTSAEASAELKTVCEENDIRVLDGRDFVDWIIESLPKLPAEWPPKLGVLLPISLRP
jgi:hypothetical protein